MSGWAKLSRMYRYTVRLKKVDIYRKSPRISILKYFQEMVIHVGSYGSTEMTPKDRTILYTWVSISHVCHGESGGGGGGETPTLFSFFKILDQFSRHGVGVSLYMVNLYNKQQARKIVITDIKN